MDYTDRRYFAIRLDNYNKQLKSIKQAIPPVKVIKPYNHINRGNWNCMGIIQDVHDGEYLEKYIQVIISCPLDDCNKLISMLKDGGDIKYNYYFEYTKESIGQ